MEPRRAEGWTESPGSARLRVGQVHADDGRGFGEPVAFVNRDAETLLDRARQFRGQLLRAGNEEAQAAQLRRLRFPQVGAQKSGRGEHDGGAVALDERGDFSRLQRAGISDDPHPFDERIPKRDRAAEAVEKWQASDHESVLGRVEEHGKLRDVAEDIAMAERDAFGRAGASAREKQYRFVLAAEPRQVEQARQQKHRRDQANQPPAEDRRFHRRQKLIEMDHILRPRKILQLLRHRPRGDDRLEMRLALRRFDRFAGAGEVDVDRNLAGEHDGDVGQHPAFAGRQHDPDPALRAMPAQMPRERDRRAEQFSARQRGVIEPIDDRGRENFPLQAAQAGVGEMLAQDRALAVADFAELEQFLPHRCDVGVLRHQRPAERDRDGKGKAARPFRKKAPALKREDRAPELVQPNRHERRLRLARDQ